jgi:(R,R)-butanediol dehydrogenase/meso-butanediol dehydrogenase/diacetyl reductase
MKAVRWHGREDLRLDDVPEPSAGPGHVVVEVAWCGICGTDLHEYLKGPIVIATEPHPATGGTFPVTMGHELSGRVAEIGPGVERVGVGDRVVVDPCLACGECWYCRTGEYVRCDTIGFVGMHLDGALARYVAVPESTVHALPDGVGDEAAALIEPLTVAMRAVRRSPLRAGDAVTIVGAGPIGLLVLTMVRAAGASEVYVIERAAARKDQAILAGATHVFDPDHGDPVEQVREASPGGRGSDVAFECVGRTATLNMAIHAARRGGAIVVLGVFEEPSPVHFNDVMIAERTLIGSVGSANDFPRTIALVASGRLDATPLITAKIGIDGAIDDGFRELVRNRGAHVKVLVDPRT